MYIYIYIKYLYYAYIYIYTYIYCFWGDRFNSAVLNGNCPCFLAFSSIMFGFIVVPCVFARHYML